MRVLLVANTFLQECVPDYVWHNDFDYKAPDVSCADELAEVAGRLCYLSWDRPNPATATNKGYLANIIKQQHFSVLEHASATFYIDGVSRNFTHELIRHRHLSFSEVSQRYVDVSEFEFVTPPALQELDIEDFASGFDVEDRASSLFKRGKHLYNLLVDHLVSRKLSRKEARQAARHLLPGGLETKILVTGNMRAWREVLQKRLSPQADKEFQLVAQKILAELKEIAPNTFQDFDDDWMDK